MKRIAVFCDGTWNRISSPNPTNVLTGAQCVLPRGADGIEQLTYYDEGVGTTHLFSEAIETRLAGAFGWGLFDKIAAAYRFLVFNYEPGDEIFIFGFSRGAFTARSLAGMIRKCGIVPKTSARDIARIFEFYKDASTHPNSDAAQAFRMKYCPEIVLTEGDRDWRIRHGVSSDAASSAKVLMVKYVGVFDTVGALGVPEHLILSKLTGRARKYQFHDTALSSTVFAARHAVAIDEDRRSFEPSLWSNLDVLNEAAGDIRYEQLWFPGDHGSVGGGGDVRGLSNGAFKWVMEGAEQQGLELNSAVVDEIVASADHLAPLHNSSTPRGRLARIYRRATRVGPQRIAELAEPTLMRLEHEVKGASGPLYRPGALRAIHRDKKEFSRPFESALPTREAAE